MIIVRYTYKQYGTRDTKVSVRIVERLIGGFQVYRHITAVLITINC